MIYRKKVDLNKSTLLTVFKGIESQKTFPLKRKTFCSNACNYYC